MFIGTIKMSQDDRCPDVMVWDAPNTDFNRNEFFHRLRVRARTFYSDYGWQSGTYSLASWGRQRLLSHLWEESCEAQREGIDYRNRTNAICEITVSVSKLPEELQELAMKIHRYDIEAHKADERLGQVIREHQELIEIPKGRKRAVLIRLLLNHFVKLTTWTPEFPKEGCKNFYLHPENDEVLEEFLSIAGTDHHDVIYISSRHNVSFVTNDGESYLSFGSTEVGLDYCDRFGMKLNMEIFDDKAARLRAELALIEERIKLVKGRENDT